MNLIWSNFFFCLKIETQKNFDSLQQMVFKVMCCMIIESVSCGIDLILPGNVFNPFSKAKVCYQINLIFLTVRESWTVLEV